MTKAHQVRQCKPLIKHVNYAGRNVRYAPLANLQITVLLNSLQVGGNNANRGGVLVNKKSIANIRWQKGHHEERGNVALKGRGNKHLVFSTLRYFTGRFYQRENTVSFPMVPTDKCQKGKSAEAYIKNTVLSQGIGPRMSIEWWKFVFLSTTNQSTFKTTQLSVIVLISNSPFLIFIKDMAGQTT